MITRRSLGYRIDTLRKAVHTDSNAGDKPMTKRKLIVAMALVGGMASRQQNAHRPTRPRGKDTCKQYRPAH